MTEQSQPEKKRDLKNLSLRPLIAELITHKNYVLSHQNKTVISFEAASVKDDELSFHIQRADLVRAFDNILNNAIDAVENCAAPLISVKLMRKGDLVEVRIADNGMGASEHQLRQLNNKEFIPTTKGSGHGIGLRSAWQIIQDHHGTLKFERPQTGGMVVTILFPSVDFRSRIL